MLVADAVKAVESTQEMKGAHDLRMKVFVGEQGVPPGDEMDEHDETAYHAVAVKDGVVVGTGRLLVDSPLEGRIGRMAVERSLRRKGLGGRVLSFLEKEAKRRGVRRISLDAQSNVTAFYASHGYVEEGEPFLEVGIPHVKMVKDLAGQGGDAP